MVRTNQKTQPPTRVEVLIDNYRMRQDEGIKLVHSFFNDIAFIVVLLGSVITGGTVGNEPKLLLLFPLLLGGIFLYEGQKFRVNNLTTSYLIYLEKEINKEYDDPVFIWNSEFIRKNVSVGRQSVTGDFMLILSVLVMGLIYIGISYWPYLENSVFFSQYPSFLYLYIAGCVVTFIVSVFVVLNALAVIKRYTPEYINQLISSRKLSYSENDDETSNKNREKIK